MNGRTHTPAFSLLARLAALYTPGVLGTESVVKFVNSVQLRGVDEAVSWWWMQLSDEERAECMALQRDAIKKKQERFAP